jgi:hypothetical protein
MRPHSQTDLKAIVEHRCGELLISTDPARLDLDVIHEFLTNCYWAKGIPREDVARSIEHSLCFGIYDESGKKSPLLARGARNGAPQAPQVGFARSSATLRPWRISAMCSSWNRIAAAA